MNGLLAAYLGVMKDGKTNIMLALIDKMERNGHKVALLKPACDTRSGTAMVTSRTGLSKQAIVVAPEHKLVGIIKRLGDCFVFVDEVQFLTEDQIDQLRILANMGYEIRCFGLLKDYCNKLFPASKRLMELMDEYHAIRALSPTYCRCGRHAIHNVLIQNGKIATHREDGAVHIGDNEYVVMCDHCYRTQIAKQQAEQAAETLRVRELLNKLQLPENWGVRLYMPRWYAESRAWAEKYKSKSKLTHNGLRVLYILNHLCPNLHHFHKMPHLGECESMQEYNQKVSLHEQENTQVGVAHSDAEFALIEDFMRKEGLI